MADISKISSVAYDTVSKVGGTDVASISKIGGVPAPPTSTGVWVAVANGGRIMYSQDPTAASGSWSDYYQISGISTI